MTAAEVNQALTLRDLIVSKAKENGVSASESLEIAQCESRLRQFASDGTVLRGRVNHEDVGVFQINEKYHLAKSEALGFDIYTTEGNVGYAMWLLKNDGARHWHWSRGCWG